MVGMAWVWLRNGGHGLSKLSWHINILPAHHYPRGSPTQMYVPLMQLFIRISKSPCHPRNYLDDSQTKDLLDCLQLVVQREGCEQAIVVASQMKCHYLDIVMSCPFWWRIVEAEICPEKCTTYRFQFKCPHFSFFQSHYKGFTPTMPPTQKKQVTGRK